MPMQIEQLEEREPRNVQNYLENWDLMTYLFPQKLITAVSFLV